MTVLSVLLLISVYYNKFNFIVLISSASTLFTSSFILIGLAGSLLAVAVLPDSGGAGGRG